MFNDMVNTYNNSLHMWYSTIPYQTACLHGNSLPLISTTFSAFI